MTYNFIDLNGENMEECSTNKKCESCKCEIDDETLDKLTEQTSNAEEVLMYDLDLVLCEICFPWVQNYGLKAPFEVLGYKIKNRDLFVSQYQYVDSKMLDLKLEQIVHNLPNSKQDWLNFLGHIIGWNSKRHQTLTHWLKGNITIKNLSFDSIKQSIIQHLVYLEHFSIDERLLSSKGWGDYAGEIQWPEPKKLIIGEHTFAVESGKSDRCIKILKINGKTFGTNIFFVKPIIINIDLFSSFMAEMATLEHNKLSMELDRIDGITTRLHDIFPQVHVPHNYQLQVEIYAIVHGYSSIKLKYRFLALWWKALNQYNYNSRFGWKSNESWAKSFQLLRNVQNSLDRKIKSTINGIRLIGKSGTIYSITPGKYLDALQPWIVKRAGKDEKICIDLQTGQEHLPLGDALASLILSLHDDLGSMQFIHTLSPNGESQNQFRGLGELLE